VAGSPRIHTAVIRRENLQGAAISVAASIGFTAVNITVKQLGILGIDAFQTIVVRTFFGLAIILPLMVRAGVAPWRTSHIRVDASRAVLGGFAVLFGYYAFTRLPLAEVTAISFTVPLFVTILAVFVLHEDVRWRRWTATAVGFLGVLIVARPFHGTPQLATLLALGMSACVGLSVMLLKTFPKKESQFLMLFYFLVASGLMAAGPAVLGWQETGLEGWLLLAGVGIVATGSQALIIRAFRIGDASFVAPFDYVRLLFAGAAGCFMFAEVPDAWTYAGSALIVGSTLHIAHRESRKRGS